MSILGRWRVSEDVVVGDKGSVVVDPMTRGMRWQLRRRRRPWRKERDSLGAEIVV